MEVIRELLEEPSSSTVNISEDEYGVDEVMAKRYMRFSYYIAYEGFKI